ncbi:MAG: alpha-ketoacid dehydrogenase subunit beta [Bacteroidetes bacterium]|nr:alpha-ketoacid dehydrogenase subunit beta [Bacteroidota bacterium]
MSLNKERKLNFALAINEALTQMLESDPSVMLIGQGVMSPWYVGNTCKDLLEKFGEARVLDTPVSENATTGAAVGAAIAGMKTIVVHPRTDFAVYALDPIINEAANWHYMSGGASNVPVVFWLIVNGGGEQAAQHSQALHTIFAHVPGLKVIAPSTPYDVKGMLIAAINDPNPVVFIDNRSLYGFEESVPEKMYEIPLGKGIIRRKGKDITLVSFSHLAQETLKAAETLALEGIDAEVIDIRTLKPLDEKIIFDSVEKTQRIAIIDSAWKFCGFSAEVVALLAEKTSLEGKSITRINIPDAPAAASNSLEQAYYINAEKIVSRVKNFCSDKVIAN